MMQWISERRPKFQALDNQDGFRNQEDFQGLMTQNSDDTLPLINLLSDAIVAQEEPPSTESFKELAKKNTTRERDFDMLLTAACALALGKQPQITAWQKIQKIAYNSWQVEHWLSYAMAAYSERFPAMREAYIELAKLLFKEAENGSLVSESERKNESRKSALMYWRSADSQLEEIWWGLRHSDFLNYEGEMRIFGLLSQISPRDFQEMIAGGDNPFVVDSALLASGIGAFNPRFSQWKACAKEAPAAFAKDGYWTGAVLLPLLLVHARNHLLAAASQVPRYGANESEVAELTIQVSELAHSVVETLSNRTDAPEVLSRWSIWLMRQMLLQGDGEFKDVRSDGFVDNALLKAIGEIMKGRKLIPYAPKDAKPWEAWSYQCVQSFFADMEFIDMPSFDEFACQWQLTPENWHQQEGRRLLARASMYLPKENIPGLSAHLLVLPLLSKEEIASGWLRLWDNAYYLREVLEFGSVDAGTENYSDRGDASRLLLLLCCMGLACFDQATSRPSKLPDRLAEEMISLHASLASAAMEVLNIDDTINRDKWLNLLRRLALRRAYWDSNYAIEHRVALFTKQHQPSIQDYLRNFQGDPNDLVTLLHACINNQMDASKLSEELRCAGVDLHACVSTLERLHGFHEYRYPLNIQAINAINPIMNIHKS